MCEPGQVTCPLWTCVHPSTEWGALAGGSLRVPSVQGVRPWLFLVLCDTLKLPPHPSPLLQVWPVAPQLKPAFCMRKTSWHHQRTLNEWHWASFPYGSAGKESACNVGDQVRSLGWEDHLKKGKAAHSSILAWRIPWTVQSMRLQSQTWLSDFHFTQQPSWLLHDMGLAVTQLLSSLESGDNLPSLLEMPLWRSFCSLLLGREENGRMGSRRWTWFTPLRGKTDSAKLCAGLSLDT